MKRLMIAAASVVALGFSAFAEDFDADIGNYDAAKWPGKYPMWSNTDNTFVSGTAPNAKLDIDADAAAPLTFSVGKEVALGTDVDSLTFTSVVDDFAEYESSYDLPAVPADAKIAITIAAGKYFVLTKDEFSATDGNTWTTTDIDAAEGPIEIKAKITADGAVEYTFGATTFNTTVYLATNTFSAVRYSGNGVLSALRGSSASDPVDFTIPTNVDATNVTVLVAGKVVTAPYNAEKGAALQVIYKANEGKLFPNGTDTYTYDGTVVKGEIPTGIDDQDIQDAQAKVGTTYYLTLESAYKAVPAEGTILLLTDATTTIATDMTKACTLDLGGNTLSYDKKFRNLTYADYFVLKNGTVKIADGVERAWIVQSFGKKLVLEDVIVDATGMIDATDEEGEPLPYRYTGAVLVAGGHLTLKGTTKIINVPSDLYAIAYNDWTGSYALGTINLAAGEDADVTIEGNIALGGGTLVNAGKVTYPEDGVRFDIGAGYHLCCEAAGLLNSGLAAMTGRMPTTNDITHISWSYVPTGSAYTTLDAALAAATAEEEPLSLLADATGLDLEISLTLNVNGFTYDAGLAELPAKTTLSVSNSVPGKGGLLLSDTFAIGGTLNLDGIAKSDVTIEGGAFTMTDAAVISAMGWAGVSANEMKADGFFDPEYMVDAATVQTPMNTYTWSTDDQMFMVEGAIATADTGKCTDVFASIAVAAAAVKDGGTVTLLYNEDGVSLEGLGAMTVPAGSKTITLDLNENIVYPDSTMETPIVAIDVTSGKVTVANGTIAANEIMDETLACYAITARSGAEATLDGLTVDVMSAAGVCAYAFEGGKITILGGSYSNTSDEGVEIYDTLAQAVVAPQAVFVQGGTFVGSDPKNFVASGFKSQWNELEGYWEIVEDTTGGTEVVPGQSVHFDEEPTPEELAKVTVALDDAQKTLDDDQQAEYKALFTKQVTGNPVDGYQVTFVPTADATNAVQTAVQETAATLLATVQPGETVQVSIDTKPGLYYSVAVSTELSADALAAGEGERTMGDGTSFSLDVTTPSDADKCFYQIMVNVTDGKIGE